MLLKTSGGCLFRNSESVRPMTQVLFDPGCAPVLDNLGGAIPCCQLSSGRGMVDSLVSVNVNVALRAVSVILHQTIASQLKRVENLGHVMSAVLFLHPRVRPPSQAYSLRLDDLLRNGSPSILWVLLQLHPLLV